MSDKEKLEKAVKLADAMYYAAQNLTTDASRLHKAMEDYHQFIINDYRKEESASEDLVDASNNYCLNIRKGYPRVKDEIDIFICNAFKAGAEWQREKIYKKLFRISMSSNSMDYVKGVGELMDELKKD